MSQARYIRCLAQESLIRGSRGPIQAHGCQLFDGPTDPMGIPLVELYQGGEMRAMDVCWELHFGPIPDGQWVEHTCGEPACVDHRHLKLCGEPPREMADFQI